LGVDAVPIDGDRPLDPDWIEWGGELIWVVGFTEGGAPYGLRTTDFEAGDLEAMGLDPRSAGSPDTELGGVPDPDAAHQAGAFGYPF